ncbi:MAG: hypothetical protein V1809_13820 [Planctomycetota bacterium]
MAAIGGSSLESPTRTNSFLPELNLGYAGVAKRSVFVINKAGTVVYAWVSEDPGKVPDFEAVKKALAAASAAKA